jgi:hypothetical protein
VKYKKRQENGARICPMVTSGDQKVICTEQHVKAADLAKNASDKALAKPWNRELYLLVFIPECPKGFEPIHNLSLHPALLLTCVIQCDLFS